MAQFTVTETTWSDRKAIQLADTRNDTVAQIVPALGANLFSLKIDGKLGRRELLRVPPDAATLQAQPARWGIPVLMPPNRISGGTFSFTGREYHLEITEPEANNHIHGFPVRRAWQVFNTSTEEGAQVTLEFKAADHPDVLGQFPHPFVLRLTYTLKGNVLRCDSYISNEGSTAMPFGLGFHPYLAAPEDKKDRFLIRLTPAKLWELQECLPTGKFFSQENEKDLSKWQPLHATSWDAGFALETREADGGSRFEMLDKEDDLRITLRASKEFGHWVIFNGYPGFKGFVCPEPYTCMTDAFNLDLPSEVTGMDVLPGETERSAGTWFLEWE